MRLMGHYYPINTPELLSTSVRVQCGLWVPQTWGSYTLQLCDLWQFHNLSRPRFPYLSVGTAMSYPKIIEQTK